MEIVMPKLGLTMTEGTLTRWRKAEGDRVQAGEILFEFESEKSVLEFESPAAGVLARILVSEGQTVPCGAAVARLETSPAERSRGASPQPENRPATAETSAGALSPAAGVYATPAARRRARELGLDLRAIAGRGPNGRIQQADVDAAAKTARAKPPATPLAQRLAADMGVNMNELSGSGPAGRVVKADVLRAASAGQTPYTAEPLTGVREVIARRMRESAFTAPHVTLFTEADASALVEARGQLNTELAPETKISYNTLLVAVAARALREHPGLNACLAGNEIRRYNQINIGLAVDTDRGLLVPVIRNADRLDLVTIQQTGNALVERALAGKSLPGDLTGGTFTLTNLGMFDVDGFTPIINQPQAAILGVGRITARPVARGGEVEIRQMMTLSLSFDHRLVDGAPAARFLQRVKQLVERPFALLIPAGE